MVLSVKLLSGQATAIQVFAPIALKTVSLQPHFWAQSELADLLPDSQVRVSFPLPLPRHLSEWNGSFSVTGSHGYLATSLFQLREPLRNAGLVKLFMENWVELVRRSFSQ